MIEKRTVLILGAGASMPYGFPSGSGLRRHIIEYLDELLSADTTSIDVFLERRTEFVEIGKAAIAATLIPLESTRNLFQTWTLPSVLMSQTWYQYFASTLQM